MSEEKFLKITCRQCGGNIEFPAEAAGQTIDCPHCGKPLSLVAPAPAPAPAVAAAEPKVKMKPAPAQWDEPVTTKESKMPQVAFLVGLLVVLAGGGWFYQSWKNRPKPVKTVAKKPVSVAAAPKTTEAMKPPPPKEEPEVPHDGPDLQVLKYQIERAKDKGSKLIYVTGTLTNHVKAQYFSVKVEFELFDKAGKSLGKISDQNANIAGRTKWDFKAMVLDDTVAKAEMIKIHGERE
ncbi:MAG: hypothetical protein HZA89_12280 [Verrucomicrobia bacterium]|nr:hypothetical protein [Verrucomicrobiota bacterium]